MLACPSIKPRIANTSGNTRRTTARLPNLRDVGLLLRRRRPGMLEDAIRSGTRAHVEVVAEQVSAICISARGFAFPGSFRIPRGIRGAISATTTLGVAALVFPFTRPLGLSLRIGLVDRGQGGLDG